MPPLVNRGHFSWGNFRRNHLDLAFQPFHFLCERSKSATATVIIIVAHLLYVGPIDGQFLKCLLNKVHYFPQVFHNHRRPNNGSTQ